MSWFSSLFKGGGGETVTAQPMQPGFQQGVGSDLAEWVKKYLPLFQPGQAYGGQFSAPQTGMETQGLGQLQGLLNAPATGPTFQAGQQQVMDTLGGKYADPATSPFIQSMISLAKQNLGDQIQTERGQRGARGTYFTRAGVQAESKLGERTQNVLNAVIGEFQNAERGRQLQAAPMAQQFDQYQQLAAPLARISASQSLGSLERTLSQADLERQYTDYQRQRQEMGTVPGAAQNLYGTQVPMGLNSVTMPKSANGFQQILSSLGGMDWQGMLSGLTSGGGGFQGAGAQNYPSLYGQGGSLAQGQSGGGNQFLSTMMKFLPMMLAMA